MNLWGAILLSILALFPVISFCQENKAAYREQERARRFFRETVRDNGNNFDILGFSENTYIFSFEAIVNKKGNKVQVSSLAAKDSIAFKLFPKYKFLETIDYSVFMKNRKHAVFIFPVVIQIFDANRPHIGKLPNPDKGYLSLFSYDQFEEIHVIEDYIYFQPFILSITGNIH